jgi:exodeoxyribonuclease VII large subunit
VGHEVDDSICDLVADIRAATPSAAAEIVSQQASHLSISLNKLSQQLEQSYLHMLSRQQIRLKQLHHQVETQSPIHLLEQQQQRFDELSHRLSFAHQQSLSRGKQRQQEASSRLKHSLLAQKIDRHQQRLVQLKQRLNLASDKHLQHQQDALVNACRQMDNLSPLRVLERGFSLVTQQENIVKSAADLSIGDQVNIRFADGRHNATIIE